MDFRTELHIPPLSFDISHQDNIITIGSCFADTMGNKLVENKFYCLHNPFGTIFNPIAINLLLDKLIHQDSYFHLIESQGIWQAYETHSSLGELEKSDLQYKLKNLVLNTSEYLKNSNLLIITLGTTVVYQDKNTGLSVANCHKIPSTNFDKTILKTDEIIEQFTLTFNSLKTFNPDLQIVLTVSPVRHIKDTLITNSLSKSTLIVASHELSSKFENVHYFPAYELLMDDLRDYRFYKDDLIHPSTFAENYIWNKFSEYLFNNETITLIQKWQKVKKSIDHKPFFPSSETYQKHLQNILKQLVELQNQIGLHTEIKDIKNRLSNI